ncbi:MAG TPA: VOC family protein [Chloroflexota bacterium]|nr:VOC family protein [Chloroflexota bacterium]
MQIQELGHVVLNVRNLDDSVGFYRDRLGLHITGEMGRAAFLAGAAGRTHHELLLIEVGPDAERGRLGLNHLAFRIGTSDDELRTALADLADKGVKPTRVVDHGGVSHSAFFDDPDGNNVELYIDVQPAWHPGLVDASRGLGRGGTPFTP